MQRLLCRLRGHDWNIYSSHPDWSTVEPVYFIETATELVLVGWTSSRKCLRCGIGRTDTTKFVGPRPATRLRTVVVDSPAGYTVY